jgi:hypothetical protein
MCGQTRSSALFGKTWPLTKSFDEALDHASVIGGRAVRGCLFAAERHNDALTTETGLLFPAAEI